MSQRCSQGMQNMWGCSSAGACKQVCQHEKVIEICLAVPDLRLLKAKGLKFEDRKNHSVTVQG